MTIKLLSLSLTSNNLMFHERNKHKEVICHFNRELLMKKKIVTLIVHSNGQLGGVLTKLLARASYQRLSCKQGIFDLYAPPWRGVLELLLVIFFISMLIRIFL